jgi:sugar phosphate isomerase/epimerase
MSSMELALTPDSRWGLDAPALAGVAKRAGFAAVGLGVPLADEAAAAALAANGVRCHELLALVLGRDDDANLRQAQALAAAADAVGAEWVLTTFGVPLTSDSGKAMARYAAMFAEAGAKMAAEFSPLGKVTSIPAALAVVEAAGAGRAGVMIDTWHYFRGDSTWEDLETVPLDRIAYVQFDDAPEPASDDGMDETMNRRAMPGDGGFELERFASTLRGRGWQGLVSVEVLNRDLRQLPVDEFARRAYETTARYWR